MNLRQFRMWIALLATVMSIGVTVMIRPIRIVSQTSTQPCGPACLQAKVNRHLLLMGEFDKEEALQASLRDLIASGPPVVRTVQDTYNHWSRPETDNAKLSVRPGEMRWRAIHLLGSLGIADAVPFLYEIARRPLPDPRKGEIKYADEYRISLRAIYGLERLKAIDELKNLRELGGVYRNPTAASLFALGVKVDDDVRLVEARKALAEDVADYKDHKEGKGRAPQPMKPGGREKIKPIRRPDTPFIRQTRGD